MPWPNRPCGPFDRTLLARVGGAVRICGFCDPSNERTTQRGRPTAVRPHAAVPGPSHAGDELLDSLVHGAERVLAQDGPLGLVVELEVYPVDGEVASLLLGAPDEL